MDCVVWITYAIAVLFCHMTHSRVEFQLSMLNSFPLYEHTVNINNFHAEKYRIGQHQSTTTPMLHSGHFSLVLFIGYKSPYFNGTLVAPRAHCHFGCSTILSIRYGVYNMILLVGGGVMLGMSELFSNFIYPC